MNNAYGKQAIYKCTVNFDAGFAIIIKHLSIIFSRFRNRKLTNRAVFYIDFFFNCRKNKKKK